MTYLKGSDRVVISEEDEEEPSLAVVEDSASLLERVLQKIAVVPGVLDVLSSDPALLHDLQERDLLFLYPIPNQMRLDSLASEDEAATRTRRQETGRLAVPLDIHLAPRQLPLAEIPVVVSPSNISPSFSMGMLLISPSMSSQDGEPNSAVWPRQPNEFAFTQPDESNEDDLYNDNGIDAFSDGSDKLFELEDITSSSPGHSLRGKVEYETMRLRIVREKFHTGLEPSQEFLAHQGLILGDRYEVWFSRIVL